MSYSCFPFIPLILSQLITERHLEKQLALYQLYHLNIQCLQCFILTDKQEDFVRHCILEGHFWGICGGHNAVVLL